MTRRYALRDDPWDRIENGLPGRADTVCKVVPEVKTKISSV